MKVSVVIPAFNEEARLGRTLDGVLGHPSLADAQIVVVDDLQLIAPPPGTPRDDRRVQVDAISRGLKQLAKDLEVPVVALTQLNRGPEQRAHKTPTLADLREEGRVLAAVLQRFGGLDTVLAQALAV